MGFLSRQDRRLAFLDRVARTPDGMGWISLNNMAGHKPVEEHANRSQVLFYGGRRQLVDKEPMLRRARELRKQIGRPFEPALVVQINGQ